MDIGVDQEWLDSILDRFGQDPGQIIAILHRVQDRHRYLPEEDLRYLANRLSIPDSRLFHLSTFYGAFSLKPKGKHVCSVCMGTACHVRGASRVLEELERKLEIKAGETTGDGEFSVDTVNCLGACALGPLVTVDGEYYGNMTTSKVTRLLRKAKENGKGRTRLEEQEDGTRPSADEAGEVRLENPTALSEYRRLLQAGYDPQQPFIAICGGTGCLALGASSVRQAFDEAIAKSGLDVDVRMKFTGCHGFCERGPLVVTHPQGNLYVGVKPKDVAELLENTVQQDGPVERLLYRDPGTGECIAQETEVPFYKHQKRLVFGMNGMIDPTSIDDYIRIGGYSALARALFEMTPEQVIAEVTKAGLRGRGGGGFSAGFKWETCRNAHGSIRYVIVNADEGDPGAYMDRSLLEGNPHSVLEGLIIGAYAIAFGVSPAQGYIYVRHEYPLAVKYLTWAVEEARAYGLLGQNILGKKGFHFDVRISQGGGAFVCGESSALMASLEGKPGEPKAKYVHTVHKGLYDEPSNLNNVETWANVPLIVGRGADWYAAMGTEKSKGTKVFSLVGKVNHTGLVEVPMGVSLREIIFRIGGGIRDGGQFKAVQTGGPSGGCLPESYLDLPVDFDELAKAGSMMGSGGMIVMDQDTCMVDVARYFLHFLEGESCGKCIPCREGIKQILHVLDRICEGEGKESDLERLVALGNAVHNTSLCALGGSAANPLLTTLKYFEDEYLTHIRDGRCPAGVCRALIEYTIIEEKCTGCLACIKPCPQDGIAGELKKPHFIDREKCIKCGICYEVCKFDAVARV